jgi:MoaA/NifB/PqqE/SkfB family radical SAM enzyme
MSRRGRSGRRNPDSLIRSAWNAVRANGESLLGIVPAPRALCFYVTYKCNLRCRTCGIWKHDSEGQGPELALEEMSAILADPLFAHLEYVNINGGEPHLRPDLPEIADLILERLPGLKSLSLNSNGIPAARSVAQVSAVSGRCRRHGVSFSVSISLHAPGPAFDQIAGLPGAWDEVQSTLDQLQRLQKAQGFYLSVNCVLSALNAHLAEDLAAWSRANGIPANFVLAEVRERFHNKEMGVSFSLRQDQKPGVIRFFRRLSREEPALRHHRLRYRVLADMLETGSLRRLSCHYRMGGAILGSRGELYYCKFSREIGNCRQRPARQIYFGCDQLLYRKKELLAATCPHCPPNTFNRIELEKDIFRYLAFSLQPKNRRKQTHG